MLEKDRPACRVLIGEIRKPDISRISFDDPRTLAYFHPRQTSRVHVNKRPTGHQVLSTLVASYKPGEDKKGETYNVSGADLIHGHFGLSELNYIEKNWFALPESFRVWAAEVGFLYGWRDVSRLHKHNLLIVPYLYCEFYNTQPWTDWYALDDEWDENQPALCEQVDTQG